MRILVIGFEKGGKDRLHQVRIVLEKIRVYADAIEASDSEDENTEHNNDAKVLPDDSDVITYLQEGSLNSITLVTVYMQIQLLSPDAVIYVTDDSPMENHTTIAKLTSTFSEETLKNPHVPGEKVVVKTLPTMLSEHMESNLTSKNIAIGGVCDIEPRHAVVHKHKWYCNRKVAWIRLPKYDTSIHEIDRRHIATQFDDRPIQPSNDMIYAMNDFADVIVSSIHGVVEFANERKMFDRVGDRPSIRSTNSAKDLHLDEMRTSVHRGQLAAFSIKNVQLEFIPRPFLYKPIEFKSTPATKVAPLVIQSAARRYLARRRRSVLRGTLYVVRDAEEKKKKKKNKRSKLAPEELTAEETEEFCGNESEVSERREMEERAARSEAEKKTAEEKAAEVDGTEKATDEEAAKLEAVTKAEEEAAKLEAEKKAAEEEAAKLEAEEEAAKLEAEKKAAEEEAIKIKAEEEEAAKLAAEMKAAEEAKLEAEKKAAEEAAKLAAEKKAAEEAAARERIERGLRAVGKLQANWRMKQQKNDYQRKKNSVVPIQALARMYISQRQKREQEKLEQERIVKQKQAQNEKEARGRIQKGLAAVGKLQANWRMKQQKKDYQRKLGCVVPIQAIARMYLSRSRQPASKYNYTNHQKRSQPRKSESEDFGRKEEEDIDEERKNRAEEPQGVMKEGEYEEKDESDCEARDERTVGKLAAEKIQATWRMQQQKRAYRQKIKSAKSIQSISRMYLSQCRDPPSKYNYKNYKNRVQKLKKQQAQQEPLVDGFSSERSVTDNSESDESFDLYCYGNGDAQFSDYEEDVEGDASNTNGGNDFDGERSCEFEDLTDRREFFEKIEEWYKRKHPGRTLSKEFDSIGEKMEFFESLHKEAIEANIRNTPKKKSKKRIVDIEKLFKSQAKRLKDKVPKKIQDYVLALSPSKATKNQGNLRNETRRQKSEPVFSTPYHQQNQLYGAAASNDDEDELEESIRDILRKEGRVRSMRTCQDDENEDEDELEESIRDILRKQGRVKSMRSGFAKNDTVGDHVEPSLSSPMRALLSPMKVTKHKPQHEQLKKPRHSAGPRLFSPYQQKNELEDDASDSNDDASDLEESIRDLLWKQGKVASTRSGFLSPSQHKDGVDADADDEKLEYKFEGIAKPPFSSPIKTPKAKMQPEQLKKKHLSSFVAPYQQEPEGANDDEDELEESIRDKLRKQGKVARTRSGFSLPYRKQCQGKVARTRSGFSLPYHKQSQLGNEPSDDDDEEFEDSLRDILFKQGKVAGTLGVFQ